MESSLEKEVTQNLGSNENNVEVQEIIHEYLTELDENIAESVKDIPQVKEESVKYTELETLTTVMNPQTIKTLNYLKEKEKNFNDGQPSKSSEKSISSKKYFTFTGDFNEVKNFFIKLSQEKQQITLSRKMLIIKNNEDSIIIKKETYDSLKCLFKCILPYVGERTVYQLNKSTKFNQKAKLTLISGDEKEFQKFKKQFLYQLWLHQYLNASLEDIIDFAIAKKSYKIDFLKKLYEQSFFFTQTKKSQTVDFELQGLMQRVRQTETRMKQDLIKEGNIVMNNSGEKKFHQKLFSELNLGKHYQTMLQGNNAKILEKKQKIKEANTTLEVLNFLEVHQQFTINSNSQTAKKIKEADETVLPFWDAIKVLNELCQDDCPMVGVEKITKFHQKLRYQCFKYHKQLQKLMNMDEQLPVIIFCVFMSKNDNLKSVISFLLHYFEKDDYHEPEKRILAALNV